MILHTLIEEKKKGHNKLVCNSNALNFSDLMGAWVWNALYCKSSFPGHSHHFSTNWFFFSWLFIVFVLKFEAQVAFLLLFFYYLKSSTCLIQSLISPLTFQTSAFYIRSRKFHSKLSHTLEPFLSYKWTFSIDI